MEITKEHLKRLIKEELDLMSEKKEGFLTDPHYSPEDYVAPEDPPAEQTKETLIQRLDELLQKWPACEEDPGSLACQYHKDLEDVVLEYGGQGCGAESHARDDLSRPGMQSPDHRAPEQIKET